jgi:hypothetical protein
LDTYFTLIATSRPAWAAVSRGFFLHLASGYTGRQAPARETEVNQLPLPFVALDGTMSDPPHTVNA